MSDVELPVPVHLPVPALPVLANQDPPPDGAAAAAAVAHNTSAAAVSNPLCLESPFLKVSRGPWRFHATSKRCIPKGTVITRNWALAHQSAQSHHVFGSNNAGLATGASTDVDTDTDPPNTNSSGSFCCSNCLATPPKLFRCSSCRSARYCGRACQRTDYAQHQFECRYLTTTTQLERTWDSSTSTVTMICFVLRTYGALRRLAKRNHQQCCYHTPQRVVGSDGHHDTNDQDSNTSITCGIDHWHAMALPTHSRNDDDYDDAEYTHILQTVSKYSTWNTTQVDFALRVFQVNNFGILNSLHETIAQGVFPHAALLNHSCDPNCILRFGTSDDTNNATSKNKNNYSTRMEIVALRDIDREEELTHSYVDLVQDKITRQTHLQQLHGFHCTCRRCQGEVIIHLPQVPPDHLYTWIVQQRNPCSRINNRNTDQVPSHTLVPWSVDDALWNYGDCAGDLETVTTHARRALQESQQHMASNNINQELVTLRQALTGLASTAPPFSRDLYQVRGAFLSALLVAAAATSDLDNDKQQHERILQEARETCRAMVAFLVVALPENHPLLGLQLFTLGDLTEDQTIHAWARQVLRTSHGTHHDLVRRLDDILES